MKQCKISDLKDHIIICGWQKKTPQIIKELHAREEYSKTHMVIISDMEKFRDTAIESFALTSEFVIFIEGDFTDPGILRAVNIEKARTAIILPDWSGNRSSRDVDARTVLTSLTIEKLNPDIYSCAELIDLVYESHMRMGHVDQIIRGGYFSGLITAHAAINENLLPFLKEFLPCDSENDFQNIEIPHSLMGKEFDMAINKLEEEKNILPIGVKTIEGELIINPMSYILKQGDILVGFVKRNKGTQSGEVIKEE